MNKQKEVKREFYLEKDTTLLKKLVKLKLRLRQLRLKQLAIIDKYLKEKK